MPPLSGIFQDDTLFQELRPDRVCFCKILLLFSCLTLFDLCQDICLQLRIHFGIRFFPGPGHSQT